MTSELLALPASFAVAVAGLNQPTCLAFCIAFPMDCGCSWEWDWGRHGHSAPRFQEGWQFSAPSNSWLFRPRARDRGDFLHVWTAYFYRLELLHTKRLMLVCPMELGKHFHGPLERCLTSLMNAHYGSHSAPSVFQSLFLYFLARFFALPSSPWLFFVQAFLVFNVLISDGKIFYEADRHHHDISGLAVVILKTIIKII